MLLEIASDARVVAGAVAADAVDAVPARARRAAGAARVAELQQRAAAVSVAAIRLRGVGLCAVGEAGEARSLAVVAVGARLARRAATKRAVVWLRVETADC